MVVSSDQEDEAVKVDPKWSTSSLVLLPLRSQKPACDMKSLIPPIDPTPGT
jgi:hypothetical protein